LALADVSAEDKEAMWSLFQPAPTARLDYSTVIIKTGHEP
jgi:hypothetical protein